MKRNKLQIKMAILENIKKGTHGKTRLMYKCNMSLVPYNKLLDNLIKTGLILIRPFGNRNFYHLTPKGRDLLYAYKKIQEKLEN